MFFDDDSSCVTKSNIIAKSSSKQLDVGFDVPMCYCAQHQSNVSPFVIERGEATGGIVIAAPTTKWAAALRSDAAN